MSDILFYSISNLFFKNSFNVFKGKSYYKFGSFYVLSPNLSLVSIHGLKNTVLTKRETVI
jgi:hypothetical protein